MLNYEFWSIEVNNKKEETPAKGIYKLKENWPELTIFERFEYVVMLFVSFLLALIILVALFRLVENVYQLIISQITLRTDFKTFQITFGMLLTLLIAFEFRNSINAVLEGKGLLIQVKIILLIALIAVARKFLVLDPKDYEAGMVAAYAVVALSLGVIYWLLCKSECTDKELITRS